MRSLVIVMGLAGVSGAGCGDEPTAADTVDTTEVEVAEPTCFERAPKDCTASATGGDGAPFTFRTRDCWTVKLDQQTITVTDPFGTGTYEAWGESSSGGTAHENLNGKHIKDFDGTRRTVLLGRATLTMRTDLDAGGVVTTFLYDGEVGWGIDNTSNTFKAELVGASEVAAAEAAEADGETALLSATSPGCGIRADNVYYEEEGEDGTPAPRHAAMSVYLENGRTPVSCDQASEDYVPLGYTPGEDNPNQVNDCYDDPRLAHT